MKRIVIVSLVIVPLVIVSGIWLANASWLTPTPDADLKILSHRGVHQRFDESHLTNETCTAARIDTPQHTYLENTSRSIEAAFSFGADAVEIDVIRTADDQFVVFHDWTLECRTNGSGRTTDYTLAQLQTLDIGYGYTADNGRSFPFRGQQTDVMPSLHDILTQFPNHNFQINVKGNRASDADALRAYLELHAVPLSSQTLLFGGARFAARWQTLESDTPVGTKAAVRACAKSYFTFGWLGHIPASCQGFGLVIPQNLTWAAAGWPRKAVARLDKAGSRVMLVGALGGRAQAIDTPQEAANIPNDYRGWVLTNRIEVIGPVLKSVPVATPANPNSD